MDAKTRSGLSRHNHLLSILTPAMQERLLPLLEPVDLPQKTPLEEAGQPVAYCYFPTAGVASVVAAARSSHQRIEVGLVGREGVTGLAAILRAGSTPHQTMMQISGAALRMRAEHLVEMSDDRPELNRLLMRYAHSFAVQCSQTALMNGKAVLSRRLARWILMADDRTPGRDFYITHEFLALMIGVRRASVTQALHLLEGKGLIRSERARIQVLDRIGLEEEAAWAYGTAEAEYKRLFGNPYAPVETSGFELAPV